MAFKSRLIKSRHSVLENRYGILQHTHAYQYLLTPLMFNVNEQLFIIGCRRLTFTHIFLEQMIIFSVNGRWYLSTQQTQSCVQCFLLCSYLLATCFEVSDWPVSEDCFSGFSHSDKQESKINMLLPPKSSWNVYSSEYIKGLEIVCNMIMNKAAEVWSKWGRE